MDPMIADNEFDIVWNSGIRFVEFNSVDEANYANASVYYGGEQVKIDAASVGDEEPSNESFSGRVEWLTMRNKYFAAILAPENSDMVDGAFVEGVSRPLEHNGIYELYNARLEMMYDPGVKSTYNFMLYLGPVDYGILESYGETFTKVVDFGSFLGLTFIVRPIAEYILLPLFKFLHSFIPNYGFVIIVFSIIIKIVLFPLTKKSYQSMKRMQQLQPKIKELKEKYKDDQQKQNSETMKLYSKYGVNPAGGCLPLLLQMPIFVALWGMFQTAIDLRQQPFILWIQDLSTPDIIYHLPFTIPFVGIDKIAGLALLMGTTTFFQQKMSVKDPSQKAMVYMMPVFLTLLFMSFPSGLNLYYFMFNVLSIGQQYLINKGKQEELKPVDKANKKKGFFSRMMEEAEKRAKHQQGKRK
jgi:YidC/Oxa1 family membrane protein insertase